MPDDVVIAKIKKNAISEIWIVAKVYEGNLSCDIREYFRPDDGAEWLPTKKGVSIPLDLLGQAVDAVDEMARRDAVSEICTMERGKTAKLRFAISEYEKHIYGDIRTFYLKTKDDTDWKPGKGVTVSLSKLGQLADALRLAEDHIESR